MVSSIPIEKNVRSSIPAQYEWPFPRPLRITDTVQKNACVALSMLCNSIICNDYAVEILVRKRDTSVAYVEYLSVNHFFKFQLMISLI